MCARIGAVRNGGGMDFIEQTLHEQRVPANPVGQGAEPGPIENSVQRGFLFATSARIEFEWSAAHKPPSTKKSILPFSGSLGSLSRRAISSRAMVMRPAAVSPCGACPKRLK